ncbi:MAG: glutamyl-tRNA reductase [Gracilibacteraceae bacterium]|jgi:glutamyl-tRNA reductase|nr:glutamyl-tRNA reductase [Gracilibacteraceae bacterium]
MQALVVGLNIKSAPVELLERLSIHHSQSRDCLRRLSSATGLRGLVMLNTCNRLEFYTFAAEGGDCADYLRRRLLAPAAETSGVPGPAEQEQGQETGSETGPESEQWIYTYTGLRALSHLFRVAAGLDSLVLGETEIQGQIARAYENAAAAGTVNKLINVWFQRALAFGKNARCRTGIDRYSTSVGSIAVELARQTAGDIRGRRILILGAGEMSELTVKHLAARGASLVMVSNRSLAKAQKLAATYNFKAYPLTELAECLERADIVFTATAAKRFIVRRADLGPVMIRRDYRPLLLIDMAVPRDVEPAVDQLAGVRRLDITDLREAAGRRRQSREAAALRIAALVERETADFNRWLASQEVLPTIKAFRRQAEAVKTEQLNRALAKLAGLTPAQKNAVQAMAHALVNQLLHPPIAALNDLADSEEGRDYALALRKLYNLTVDETESNAPAASP